jgi:hypothetical protein
MTINYTTLLGLAKPVTGTESGTWGDVVNDQITSLVEDAIANAASLNVASGNVTLTDNNGSSDQARMAILLVTGTPGVSRNIVAPSTSKWYIVKNGSNAEVVLKGSATTGVTIPAGVEALAFWNGSDFELVSMVGPSSSTDNAITRYDGTTGKVVQNSGVTIDDSNNMTGVVALTTTGVVTVPAGTNSAPAITTTGDTNTGIFFPAADTIAFTEGGTESMRIDASGNLGIGVTPSAWSGAVPRALQFGSNAAVNAGAALYLTCNGFYNGTNWIYQNTDLASYYIQNVGTHQWYTATSGTAGNTISFSERMRLDSSGNLGIGVTPSAWSGTYSGALQIKSAAIYSASDLRTDVSSNFFYDGSTFKYINTGFATALSQVSGQFRFFTAPSGTAGNAITFTQAMTLDADGDLGIGTSSPGDKLTVAAGRIRLDQDYQIVWQNAGTNRARIYGDSGNTIIFENGSGNTERMRITSGGDVGIGTNSPASFGLLAVKKDQTADTAIAVSNAGTSNAATTMSFVFNEAGASQGWFRRYRDGTGNTEVGFSDALLFTGSVTGTKAERMRIDSSGLVGIGTNSPTQRLDVSDNLRVRGTRISQDNSGGNAFEIGPGAGTGDSAIWGFYAPTSRGIAFLTNTAERARITSAGQLLVGTTTSSSSLSRFNWATNARTVEIENTNASLSTDAQLFVYTERNTTNNSYYYFGCYNGTAGAYKLRIADSGDVTNTNGTYGTISDQKMKTDIVDAGSQWTDIKALRFRKFKMKDDPSGLVQLGVVAQEVELTSPGLVDEHQDRDAEGNDLGTTTKSVKTSVLLMKAAVALQEAMARIEQLEAKVSALESKGA